MKRCEHCNVDVNTSHNTCPLCFGTLTEVNKKPGTDPFKQKEEIVENKSKIILFKLFLFFSIVAATVCVVINLMTKPLPLWSLIVVIGILYCWVLIAHTIISKRGIFEKIFLQVGVIIGLLFVCEWVSGGDHWMVNYVMPTISIIVMTVLFILSQALKYHKGLFSYFIMTIILTANAGILLLCHAATFDLLNVITVCAGVVALIGMMLFSGSALRKEFSKKFHL